jgi:hypothetical protein
MELSRPVLISIRAIPHPGKSTMATATYPRGVAAGERDTGLEAVNAVREVRDNMSTALDKSLQTRPYTTLALAAILGFVLGALWAH